MSLVKTFIETPRYSMIKNMLNKQVKCRATYVVHGIDKPTGRKTTCLSNIKIHGTTLDHVWIVTDKLAKQHLKQGQSIDLVLKPVKRIRPGDSINERLLDISFKLVHV